ncbi:hypothetical protein JCM17092_27140 [Haloplanus litoreus]
MTFPSVPKRLKFARAVKEMPESWMELVRAAVRVAMERFEAMFEKWATAVLNVAWDGTTRPQTAVTRPARPLAPGGS